MCLAGEHPGGAEQRLRAGAEAGGGGSSPAQRGGRLQHGNAPGQVPANGADERQPCKPAAATAARLRRPSGCLCAALLG